MIPSLLELSLSGCSLSIANFVPYLNSSTKLANIKHLDLSSNNFQDGPLPRFLQNMNSLAFLDLSGYNLSQAWNSENMLNMIPSVSELHLSDCELQKINFSPTYLNFSTRSNIQHLDLSWNQIEGRFPSVLTNLSSLLSLDLSYNFLNSSIPVMPKLLKLDLSGNKFGRIEDVGIWRHCHLMELIASDILHGETTIVGPSANVSECSQYAFEMLNIRNNNLKGPISEALGNLRSLQVLELSSNYLSDSLGRSIDLTELLLQSNWLTGHIPLTLGKLTSLQVFSLSSNLLNGTIPVSFGQLTKIYFLDASNNSLQGVVSEAQFANLSALKYLNIAYNNHLTFNVSRDWIPPFQLNIVSLESCNISDEFPQWFQTQQNLKELVLSNTSISGPLPTWLRQMPIIRVLDLSYNKLTGTLTNLPSGDLLNEVRYQAADILLMQNNLFTGSIPRLLCTRTDLTILDLSRNRLTGNIPECLGNLKSLTKILLGSNKLSGSLPSSLGCISSSLTWLQLNDNNFSGELPNEYRNFV
ncbi:leucine-rich repeat protein [Tanacetum coccineum]